MTLRILAVSTSKNTSKILKELEEIGQKYLSVELHIGNTEDDIKASALTRMNGKRGRLPHLFKEHRFTNSALSLMKSKDFHTNAEQFIEQLHRRSEVNSYKSHKILTLGDYSDYYHILSDTIADLLNEKKIDHCVFLNILLLVMMARIIRLAQVKPQQQTLLQEC